MEKSQKQIEEEYYYIDLPYVIKKKNEELAKQVLEGIKISTFPHIEESARKQILNDLQKQLPNSKENKQKYKSPDQQYEELKSRMGK